MKLALLVLVGCSSPTRPPVANHGGGPPKRYIGLHVGMTHPELGTKAKLPLDLSRRNEISLANGTFVIGAVRGEMFVVLLLDQHGVVIDTVEKSGKWVLTAMCDPGADYVIGLVAEPCPNSGNGGSWKVHGATLVPVVSACECLALDLD